MQLTDTHIHLYSSEYNGTEDQLIAEAVQSGITTFIMPNIDSTTITLVDQLAEKYPGQCYPMMGLHPCYVKENYLDELAITEQKLRSGKYIAVGECGLDKYWDLEHLPQQIDALTFQLRLAHELNLPIALHTRNATTETIDLIESLSLKGLRGVFHCFGGTTEEAERIINLGFYLGIGGVLTFKNSGLDQIVKNIDISHLVLETDGPYLAPAPHRGKRNDPAYLLLVAQKLAAIKNKSVDEIAELTSANARKLFSL